MAGGLRTPARTLAVLACALVTLAVGASSAGAVTRTVVATDPTGDGPTPGRDVTGVRAHWDSLGSLVVTVAFAGPVQPADRAQITANARAADGRKCLLESQDTYLLLSGYTGAQSGDDRGFGIGSPGWLSLDVQRVRADDGTSVTVLLDDPRIGEYDLGCVDVRLSADGAAVDAVEPIFFADGVDSDGDGVADGRDGCPDAAAKTADGCPLVGATTTTSARLPRERRGPPASAVRLSSARCVVPDVRRVTPAVATRRLRRAGCRVGRVRRVERPGVRGAWVVRRQSSKVGARHVTGTRVSLTLVRRAR